MPDGRRRSEHEENRPHHQRRKRPGNSLKTKRAIRMTGKAENPATIKPRQKNDGVCQRSEAPSRRGLFASTASATTGLILLRHNGRKLLRR
jgi:hypothetical protein